MECEHFLITGATGAGKSMAIRSLLRQIQARGDLAIVVDPECQYVSEFYRPAPGDSTSHSAQGATVDRVIVNIDSQLSPELVNRKQLYVSISRARNSLAIYTRHIYR